MPASSNIKGTASRISPISNITLQFLRIWITSLLLNCCQQIIPEKSERSRSEPLTRSGTPALLTGSTSPGSGKNRIMASG